MDKYPAKISRPIFHNALVRERLFAILDGGGGEQLFWISGPAGFGKTTLISSYIDNRGIPCIWYQWDNGDQDPATFYHYLGLACRKETASKRKPIPSYQPEYALDPDTFSRRFFEGVFGRMDPPNLLVFDNLTGELEKYFLETLQNAISRIPAGVKIVVVTRSDLPSELSILNVRSQIKVIGVEELRFDFNEFKKVAALNGLQDTTEHTLRKMYQAVEGWVAGLVLLAQSCKRSDLDLNGIGDLSVQEIYDFFAGEIDREINGETRNFLMRTAFLPHLTCDTASRLTGFEQCETVMRYLATHNLFTARKNTTPVTYQYHSLFRNYLREKALRSMEEEDLISVKRNAARILRDTQQFELAAELLIESELWEDLSALIIENAHEMMESGRHHLLKEWIVSLPEEILSGDQNLQYWLGICTFPFSPKTSRPHFLKSIQLARNAGDASTTYRAWVSAVDSVVFEFNDLSKLDGLIETFDDIRAVFPEYPSRDVEGTVATGMLTALLFRQLEHPMIDQWAQRAVSLAREKGVLSEQILVALVESMRQFYLGNMVEMRVTIETLIEPLDIRKAWISVRPLVHYLLALKMWTLVDMESCLDHVAEGLEIARDTGVHIWDILLLGQGAVCVLSAQDMNLAAGYLDRINKLLSRASRHDRSHYHYLSAWASYMEGEMSLARNHAQKAYDLKTEVGAPFGIGSNGLALAETLWFEGEKEKAGALLEESKKTADRTGSALLLYLCQITETWFALDDRDMGRAVHSLKLAFTLGAAKSIYNFYWFRRDVMSRLCSLAIEKGIMVIYAQELIRRHNLPPTGPVHELEDWPWPVKLYTLGRFELLVGGRKVHFIGKSQERPVSLLKAIAALGGRKVNAYTLIESLWPDSDGAAGQQALATTLHRLRKLIGIEDAVIFSKGNVTLNPKVFWVDIWVLERAMRNIGPRLESAPQDAEVRTDVSSQVEKVLGLYRGHFLTSDGNEPWTIAPRERLRSKYLRNLMDYCSWLEAHEEYSKAIGWYKRALELDSLSEELYQGLMQCYARLGQKADVLATYNRCRNVLKEVLGVEPSRRTEEIRERVVGSS